MLIPGSTWTSVEGARFHEHYAHTGPVEDNLRGALCKVRGRRYTQGIPRALAFPVREADIEWDAFPPRDFQNETLCVALSPSHATLSEELVSLQKKKKRHCKQRSPPSCGANFLSRMIDLCALGVSRGNVYCLLKMYTIKNRDLLDHS